MLEPRTASNGVVILLSPLLRAAGFAHAFSTRLGGASAGSFGPLNLQSVQANARIPEGGPRDLEAAIVENHARFALAAGLPPSMGVADVSQVHGCEVVAATEALAARRTADAITSGPDGPAVLVRIADCVPVLVADPSTGCVAAIHAGWRGIVSGVVPAAIAALAARGASPASCVAAIGPCISAGHFEIGPEVAASLAEAGLGACVDAPGVHGPKHHADLVRAARMQLVAAGVPERSIDADPPCTFADPARFHSFRRDGARSGRLAAVIAPARRASVPPHASPTGPGSNPRRTR